MGDSTLKKNAILNEQTKTLGNEKQEDEQQTSVEELLAYIEGGDCEDQTSKTSKRQKKKQKKVHFYTSFPSPNWNIVLQVSTGVTVNESLTDKITPGHYLFHHIQESSGESLRSPNMVMKSKCIVDFNYISHNIFFFSWTI